jgi:hypothetical protein
MNLNSSLNWLPKIEAAGLPTPRTITIPYSHTAVMPIFDGEESAEMDRLVIAVKEAASAIGLPVFIRTDLGSAKHSGPTAYCIDSLERAAHPICRTIEDNEMKFWLEREGPKAILVRQFLTLEAPFTAFHGLPISREWRLFSDGERIICRHPYWPAEALAEHHGLPVGWRAMLKRLHRLPLEMPEVERLAVLAAKVQDGGSWSVDLAKDTAGKWWLTDMATMADSYHWPGCPNGEKQ